MYRHTTLVPVVRVCSAVIVPDQGAQSYLILRMYGAVGTSIGDLRQKARRCCYKVVLKQDQTRKKASAALIHRESDKRDKL